MGILDTKESGSLDEINFNHNNEFQVIENAQGLM